MNNKKWIIIGVLSLAIISTIGYLYYLKNKKVDDDKSDVQPIKLEKLPEVDNNSQAVKITEKKLSQFKDNLSYYEYKNNSLYDKSSGGKISEDASWSVWAMLYRNYNSLFNGVNNDKTINKATKEYALNVLAELKKILDKTFPPTIYNTSSKVFTKLKLNTIKEQNIYNEKI